MSTNPMRDIEALGQSIWLDNLSRGLVEDGGLQKLIDEDGLTGVTSNPSIFQKSMADSDRYDDEYRDAGSDDPQKVFEHLAYKDVQGACDLLRGVYDATDGQDGFVSFELAPSLSFEADKSVEAAVGHHERIDRENVLIKVPGTAEGVQAFEELTARGINVNVTLLFDVGRYREIAEAYIRGLERRVEQGQPVDRAASVASFFVSRVDTAVDEVLEEKGRSDLAGKAAVANAKLAYEAFGEIFSGERWEKLAAQGAHVQRPLWASTSVKNPDYKDTMYVDDLIGPHTVNTMPDETIDDTRDHGTAGRTVDEDVAGAHELIEEVKSAGVDFDHIVSVQLVDEGVKKFADAYDELMDAIAKKAQSLTGVS